MLTPSRAQAMVKIALQTKAPVLYRELQQHGTLDQFIDDLAHELLEFVAAQMDRVLSQVARNPDIDYLHSVQDLTATLRSAEEQAIATYLEFPPETNLPEEHIEAWCTPFACLHYRRVPLVRARARLSSAETISAHCGTGPRIAEVDCIALGLVLLNRGEASVLFHFYPLEHIVICLIFRQVDEAARVSYINAILEVIDGFIVDQLDIRRLDIEAVVATGLGGIAFQDMVRAVDFEAILIVS